LILPVKTDSAVGIKDDLADFFWVHFQGEGVSEADVLTRDVVDDGSVAGEEEAMAVFFQITADFLQTTIGEKVDLGPKIDFRIFAVIWFGDPS